MSEQTHYVYLYSDPRTSPPTPLYVGKGTGKRERAHLTEANNPVLRRKIAKIRAAGLEPVLIRVQDELSEQEAFETERALIAKLGRLGLQTGPLCNLTEGGEGTVGFHHSEATKQNYSTQRKGKKQTPAQYAANCNRPPQSEEARCKKSLAAKGHRRHTPDQIEAIREHNRTRVISDETRALWSLQRKGKKQTPEHVAKVQEAKRVAEEGRKAAMAEEEWASSRATLYAARTGTKRSEETKARMRAAWLVRKAREARHVLQEVLPTTRS